MADATERLQIIVDATTGAAEARFEKLTKSARETGDVSVKSAADVASAADRVLAAQAKQADAAGQVLVAERRLQELRDSGRASASQLEAAEQKLESTKRRLHLATRDVSTAEGAQERATRASTDAIRDAERAQRDYGAGLGDLRGNLRGLLVGGAVVAGLRSFTEAADESARIGARTENVIRTTGQAANLTADQVGDLAGAIAAKTGVDDEAIQSGANLLLTFTNVKNAAGEGNDIFSQATQLMTDMSAAMGTDVSGAAVQLGKALNDPIRGVTALSKAGVSFTAEQREQIRTLVESGNVMGAQKIILGELSKEFGGAAEAMGTPMDRARVAVGNLGETIGSVLLPVVGVAADVINAVAQAAGTIPLPFGLAAAAAVALGVAKRSAATDGSLLSRSLEGTRTAVGSFREQVTAAAAGPGLLSRSMGAARVAGGGLMAMMGGPLGLAVTGLGLGFTLLNSLTGDNEEESQAAAQAQQDLAGALRQSGGAITENVRTQAAQLAQQKDLLSLTETYGVARGDVTKAILGDEAAYDRVRAAAEQYAEQQRALADDATGGAENMYAGLAAGADDYIDRLDEARGSTEATADAQGELAGELEQTADKAGLATAATDALKLALDDGNVSTAELSRLAGEAATAQDAAAAADNRAAAAVDAYRATTSGAVTATLDLINARYGVENANAAFLNAMDAANKATDDGTTSVDEQRQAQVALMEAALAAAKAAADAAVQNAEAAGQVVDDVTEAQIRADSMLADLRAKLNTPGLTQGARDEMQGLIDQLQGAKDRGDIQAVLTLTGADEAATELDTVTEDREATVTVESRNGPAVDAYLDSLAGAVRLAIIRTESRNGPAVDAYLREVAGRDRLALVRVESRNGPAVDNYLDGLARERLAIIRVESRGGPAVDAYLDGLASQDRVARIDVRRPTGLGGFGAPALFGAPATQLGASSSVSIGQLIVQPQVDGGGRLSPTASVEVGRQTIASIRAYEQKNGTGWRAPRGR